MTKILLLLLGMCLMIIACSKDDGNNENVKSEEWTFTTENPNKGTVTDIDDNTYKAVKIGEQWWMAENLKVTHYADGTEIPLVEDNREWANQTTSAYCWYNNKKWAEGKNYGALYNWYTVETGKLCPDGWHVPSDENWTKLENYMIANGYNHDGSTSGNKIAKALASKTGWDKSDNEGAIGNNSNSNNRSSFNGFPAGYRHQAEGFYQSVGDRAYWWSYTQSDIASDKQFSINSLDISLFRFNFDKGHGLSIRCIKD
ncbi:MAG: fibrobacter succinogenes major paralogous domain-containing protein [Marinifilum sp.]|jgi:uncharacterized protein (TIGR02145 family)|nr:fibrobacter succinogenes major paralogous domain-containing protein [Marinifilum sp.]